MISAPLSDQGQHTCEIARDPTPKAVFKLLEEMWVERGTRADWDLLSALHYKMESTPVGAKYWRLVFRGETIGVCVFGMSRPLLKERHALFPLLTPGQDTQISNIHRYAYINDNFRVIGRLVVDTMFRSAGVAYRFANLSARMYGFRFCEIQSSMSKYNFFAQRAGFEFVKPIRSIHYDKGLKFMRRWFAAHPADQEALMEEFNAMKPGVQLRVEKEMKAFYFAHSPLEKTGSRRHYSEGVVEDWPVRRAIQKIQGLCFTSPLYGVYRNPDGEARPIDSAQRVGDAANVGDAATSGIEHRLPAYLPLLAFDLQGTEERLRADLLDTVPGWGEMVAQFGSKSGDIGSKSDDTGSKSDDTGSKNDHSEAEKSPIKNVRVSRQNAKAQNTDQAECYDHQKHDADDEKISHA